MPPAVKPAAPSPTPHGTAAPNTQRANAAAESNAKISKTGFSVSEDRCCSCAHSNTDGTALPRPDPRARTPNKGSGLCE